MKVQIFAMNVKEQNFDREQWKRYLSEQRIDAAGRMKREQRQLFLGAEALLNRSLELEGMPVPLPAVYARNPHGKPFLTAVPDLYVNWTHSGTYVLCALADHEVGIDIQCAKQEPKDSLVNRVLQPEEMLFYNRTDRERKTRLFYEYWTLKESYLKALGTGFHTSLNTFFIQMEGMYPEIVQRDGKSAYTVRILDFAEEEYAAAFCMEGQYEDMEKYGKIKYIVI